MDGLTMDQSMEYPRGIVRNAMRVQVAWAILSATWNAVGVAMIAQGGRSPGPTASIVAAIVLFVTAIAYPMTIRRWPVVYLLVSLVGGLAAISAVGIADQVAAPNSRRSMVPTIAAAAGGLAAGVAVASLLSPKTAQAATRGMRRQPVHSNPGHGVPIDTDGDGVPDAVGFDNDHDGRFDAIGIDTDHDGKIDALGIDRDQDGHIEVMGRDTDHDGHLDTFGFDTDHDGEIDAVAHDYDGDGDVDDYSDA